MRRPGESGGIPIGRLSLNMWFVGSRPLGLELLPLALLLGRLKNTDLTLDLLGRLARVEEQIN